MDAITTNDRYLSSEEAEQFLGLARGLLTKWRCIRRSVQPPYVKISSRCIRYRLSTLERWAADRTVDPSGPGSTPVAPEGRRRQNG